MNFEELVDIVAKLRSPDGCPWDREQTRESLKPYLVEEFYEVIDAIDACDDESVKEELGDLLFQIVFQSQLYSEEGKFNIHDVVDGVARKMVGRHPHVFGDMNMETSEDVKVWWAEKKKIEGKDYGSAIGGVPKSLPALLKARNLQRKATKIGFDWKRIEDVFDKLDEEINEFKEALNNKNYKEVEDEIGDIFFVLVRISNFVNVNPEDALRKTVRKFTDRFRHMEKEAAKQGRELSDMTLDEMETLWKRAKKR